MKSALPRFALSLTLGLAVFSPLNSLLSPPALAQTTQAQEIVIYSASGSALDKALRDALQKTLTASDLEVLEGGGQTNLNTVLQSGPPELQQGLRAAGQILQPHWSWTPIALTGPHPVGDQWVMRAEAELSLELTTTRQAGGRTTGSSILRQQWHVHKDIPIRDTNQLLSIVQSATGVSVDLNNAEQRNLVLEVVKQIPAFKELLGTDPALYLGAFAEEEVRQSELSSLGNALQPPQQAEQIQVSLPQQQNSPPPPSTPQPPPDSSDKLGLNIALRGGTVPLWLSGPAQQYQPLIESFFTPDFQLDLEYEIGRLINLNNLFVVASGGANLPVGLSAYELPTLQQQVDPTLLYATALGINGELGLSYKIDFGPWLLHLSARGGLTDAFLMPQYPSPNGTPSALMFGGTALVGGQWKLGSDFLLGLDTGFRFYTPGAWSVMPLGSYYPQQVPFPPLTSWGPVIQAYFGYRL